MTEETVRFAGASGDEIAGLLVRPDADARDIGVVLVHEARGLDERTRAVARRFADEGFLVLAPDLCSRQGSPTGDLPDRRVLGDLEGALVRLSEEPGVERLAAVGTSIGGTWAYLLGCHSTRLDAVVEFYGPIVYPELGPGRPIQPLEMSLNLSCPLLAHFGAEDETVPAKEVEALRHTLSQFSREFDIVIHPGAGHGFLDSGRHPDAAEAAWSRTLAFLDSRRPT